MTMTRHVSHRSTRKLRIIPAYTGYLTLEEALQHPESLKLLWIEILLNSDFSWEKYLHFPEVDAAYQKARIWYGHFKTMVDGHAGPVSLAPKRGKIDEKEYRRLMEALNFVSA